MADYPLPPEIEAAIEKAVADGSVFSENHRRPDRVETVGDGSDIIAEVTIRVLLPDGAAAMDAITHRLGQQLDVLLADCRLERQQLHLDRNAPLASYAEIVLRPTQIAIKESP